MANEGPLTRADFEALFRSVNDPSYVEPFLELGEGKGLEAHAQVWEQFALVSESVDSTFGSLYILPFSGQTALSARGGAKSFVELTFTRSAIAPVPVSLPVVLPTTFLVAELEVDMGPGGGVEVETGRRYQARPSFGFGPGSAGPLDVAFDAELIGKTYDRAAPGSITALVEQGAGLTNSGASIVPGSSTHQLVLAAVPDVISSSQVGAYVFLYLGSNAGRIARIVGYHDPDTSASPPTGGTALLAADGTYRLATSAGQFSAGEKIVETATGAVATVALHDGAYLVAQRGTGSASLQPGLVWVGLRSGAVAIADSVDQAPDLVAEAGTASWRVLGWATDFGLSAVNALAPSGGSAAMLDELGSEVDVGRAPNEDDDSYARRIAAAPDLVTPGALIRAANRILSRFGLEGKLREVGSADLPGLFFDGDPSSVDPAIAFAYDMDLSARGGVDAEKLDLSLLESRAFFLLEVPETDLGEFGAAFDAGPSDAFDCDPWLCFFDGYPLTFAGILRNVWQEEYRTRAGGIGFDLQFPQGS